MKHCFAFLSIFLVAASAGPLCSAQGNNEIVAVCSRVSKDYVREKGADGKTDEEFYAFGEGGSLGGEQSDYSIDKLKFMDIAKVISGPLAKQSYVSATDPKKTKLLIMVFWGLTNHTRSVSDNGIQQVADSTKTFESTSSTDYDDLSLIQAQAFTRIRDMMNVQNGKMLGFEGELEKTEGLGMTPLSFRRTDVMSELEQSRYFVILMAFDFQLMWKQKKVKLLWETRYSLEQRGNDFEKCLADMTRQASRYFGEDSEGVQRQPLPKVKVDIGETKFLNYEEKGKQP